MHPLGRHDFSSPTRKAAGRFHSTTTFSPPATSKNYNKFDAQHFFDAHGRRATQIQDHLATPTHKLPTVTSTYINLLPPRKATDRRKRNTAPLTIMSRPTKPIASDYEVKPTEEQLEKAGGEPHSFGVSNKVLETMHTNAVDAGVENATVHNLDDAGGTEGTQGG
jgi:hypothetical protein